MIIFNGSTGGLGAYLRPALSARGLTHRSLSSRLEDREALRSELEGMAAECKQSGRISFLQLAARVSVPACEQDPEGALRTNVTDTLATVRDVCEFGRLLSCGVRVVYVSTGHVYATQPSGVRLTEEHPVAPRSVYAKTKLQAEEGVRRLAAELGALCVVARLFGLVGPRQPSNYVLPGLIRRVREGRLSDVPGVSFSRDYLDARDACEALVDLAELGAAPPEVVNVCSGEPVTLRRLVELIAQAERPAAAERLLAELGEAPARPDDVPWIVGNPDRLRRWLGREPRRIFLEQTVSDALHANVQ